MDDYECSFLQCPFPVDLVEIGLSNHTSVLCVARDYSKIFIALKIVQEVQRKSSHRKFTLIVSEHNSGSFSEQFMQAIELQTSLKCCISVNQSYHDICNADIQIASPSHTVHLIESGTISWFDINLVIIDDCHLVTHSNHQLKVIMDHFKSHDHIDSPILVGLCSQLPVTSPYQIKSIIDGMESIFGCSCSVSCDLVAMNRYGEPPQENVIRYTFKDKNDGATELISLQIDSINQYLANKSENNEASPSQLALSHIGLLCNYCNEILKRFGLTAAFYHAKIILREVTKMEKKVVDPSDIEALHYCKEKLSLIQKMYCSEHQDCCEMTQLVGEIISSLWVVNTASKNSNDSSTSPPNETCRGKEPFLSYIEKCDANGCKRTPVSVILCLSDYEAAALNFLLNKVAKTKPELSCVKSAYVSSSNIRQSEICEDAEEVHSQAIIQLINNGEVNVLVLSQCVENEIYISSCKQLLRFGIPRDYLSYVKVKRIVKSANAEVIFVEADGNWKDYGIQLHEDLKSIENILSKRCEQCKFAVKDSAFWELNSASDEKCGLPDESILAIPLINRYCSSFPNDGFGCSYPHYFVKVTEKNASVHLESTLYLPCHSPVYWPFQGSAVIPKEYATPSRIAEAYSKSCVAAAVLACKALLDTDELEKQGPRLSVDSFTFKKANIPCSSEVADGCHGNEGSTKRRRAYERKFPSVLMKNLPVAEIPSYLYHILITTSPQTSIEEDLLTQGYTCSNMLGLLSRNRLPKIPKFIIYNKAIELTVSITECANSITLTTKELGLIQRFHEYIHTEIMHIGGDLEDQLILYEPEKQTYGCYIVPLDSRISAFKCKETCQTNEDLEFQKMRHTDSSKDLSLWTLNLQDNVNNTEKNLDLPCGETVNESHGSGSESDKINKIQPSSTLMSGTQLQSSMFVAFDFLKNIEQDLGDLSNPQIVPPQKCNDFECYRGRIVTAVYMDKPMKYVVSDILYDMNPLSPFPDPEVASTFSDYFKQRYGLEVHENQPLLNVRSVSKVSSCLASKYRDSKGQERPLPSKESKRHKRSKILLIPELCSIHPVPSLLWKDVLFVPTILCRLEAILLAEELRQTIATHSGVGSVEWPKSVGLPMVTTGEGVGEYDNANDPFHDGEPHRQHAAKVALLENQKDDVDDTLLHNCSTVSPPHTSAESFVNSKETLDQYGIYEQPSSTLILKALTCAGAMDVFNHDRLEMYGDAFIKFAVSLNMYCESPLWNVGKLSFHRGLTISNRQLFYLGRALNMPCYIFNVKFQPLVSWCPHGFRRLKSTLPQDSNLKLSPDVNDSSDNEDDPYQEIKSTVAKLPPDSSVEIDGHLHIVASDKIVADTSEAIIGAYLVTSGAESALGVMKWLGLDVTDYFNSEHASSVINKTRFFEPTRDNPDPNIYSDVCLLEAEFEKLETSIGYSFRNKRLLLQAFTHVSYPRNLSHLNSSYEQLEFLGDALLDYLVTRYLYFTYRNMSPGSLTDLRSAIVNSYSFAFLSVQYGLHKHLRSMSPAIFRVGNKFSATLKDTIEKKKLANPDQIFSSVFVPLDDNDENNEGIEVPKVMADIFESVIAAIFIDSGMDVETTWLVVYKMLRTTFDHYADHPPCSPIRQLKETFPNDVCFSSCELSITGRYSCSVAVKGFGKFKGTGRSLKIARSTAAQRALARIEDKKANQK